MANWIIAICNGLQVGLYLADISGAFDKVCTEILVSSLDSAGIACYMYKFLAPYLSPRVANVFVGGSTSLD